MNLPPVIAPTIRPPIPAKPADVPEITSRPVYIVTVTFLQPSEDDFIVEFLDKKKAFDLWQFYDNRLEQDVKEVTMDEQYYGPIKRVVG